MLCNAHPLNSRQTFVIPALRRGNLDESETSCEPEDLLGCELLVRFSVVMERAARYPRRSAGMTK